MQRAFLPFLYPPDLFRDRAQLAGAQFGLMHPFQMELDVLQTVAQTVQLNDLGIEPTVQLLSHLPTSGFKESPSPVVVGGSVSAQHGFGSDFESMAISPVSPAFGFLLSFRWCCSSPSKELCTKWRIESQNPVFANPALCLIVGPAKASVQIFL
ncbi:MAG: hypothetical protein R2788_07360 [Saprospiraceae bacterium]